jgi:hypothetical protein
MRLAFSAAALFSVTLWASGAGATSPATLLNLDGSRSDPFGSSAKARVFLFVRTDCPITNRYAPELQRLAKEFAGRGVDFWLVYADPAETPSGIRKQFEDYHFPGKALRDPGHQLVNRARATVAPEAAVFDAAGHLIYHGRIDDLWVAPGKARPAPLVHDLEAAVSAVLAGKPVARAETQAVGCSLADVQ